MSYDQPGPYGQQPPQGPPPGQPGQPSQSPYGQVPPQAPGQAPGGPGYGYPQAPGQAPGQVPPQQAPYGQPQAPGGYGQPEVPGGYGQQPPPPGQYPGQAPYGQVPPQPPQKKSNRNLVIGAAVVVVLAVAAGGVFLLSGDDSSGPSDDGTQYMVSMPETSGEFTRLEGEADLFDDEDLEEVGLTNMQQDAATYMNTDPAADVAEPGTVSVNAGGAWGEVADPEAVVEGLMAAAGQGDEEGDLEAEPVGEPQDFTDDDAYLQCQNFTSLEPHPMLGYDFEVTICVWADYSTVGATMLLPFPDGWSPNDDPSSLEPPEPTTPERGAEIARQLRLDSVIPAEGGDTPPAEDGDTAPAE